MTKVLIIEDEESLLEMYKLKFTKEGFEVLTASDGERGLQIAEKEKPDIILLDIILPKIDGFDALKQLRAKKGFETIPIIMLTNLGQKEDLDKGKKLGATDYVIKANFTPMEVVEKVREVLDKK